MNHQLQYRPVMSLNRKACTCYQQQNKDNILPNHYMTHIDQLPTVTCKCDDILKDSIDYIDPIIKLEDIYCVKNDCNTDIENKIYLSQNDFQYGTYRIGECGEYIFTEDIICNFNGPTHEEELDINFSPNNILGDELYWFPTHSKENSYPGLYDFQMMPCI